MASCKTIQRFTEFRVVRQYQGQCLLVAWALNSFEAKALGFFIFLKQCKIHQITKPTFCSVSLRISLIFLVFVYDFLDWFDWSEKKTEVPRWTSRVSRGQPKLTDGYTDRCLQSVLVGVFFNWRRYIWVTCGSARLKELSDSCVQFCGHSGCTFLPIKRHSHCQGLAALDSEVRSIERIVEEWNIHLTLTSKHDDSIVPLQRFWCMWRHTRTHILRKAHKETETATNLFPLENLEVHHFMMSLQSSGTSALTRTVDLLSKK